VFILAGDARASARLRERPAADGMVACGQAGDQATAMAMIPDAGRDLASSSPTGP
jgi:hypothetical protein